MIYMRDIDGTGSLHPCAKSDPGAVPYAPVNERTEAEFHKRIRGLATKRQQGYIMGAFRDVLGMNDA